MKIWLKNKIKALRPGVDFDILVPPDDKMGAYSTNVAFTRNRGNAEGTENAEETAKKLVEELKQDKELTVVCEKIEAVKPGFVNFFLKREFLQKQLVENYKNLDSVGKSDVGKGKTVIVEDGGTNIAKPMHVGHLRSTIIGDGLANVYEFLGYKVIRWNYIGDWGTQFGNLIAAYKLWGDEKKLKADPIGELLRLYVKFSKDEKENLRSEERRVGKECRSRWS